MKTLIADKTNASYNPFIDMLYVGECESCYSIEDTPSGITVMYEKDGTVLGVEIPYFTENYSEAPVDISVDSSVPFCISVFSYNSF